MKEIVDIFAAGVRNRVQQIAEEGAKRAALVLAGAFMLVCGFVGLMVAAYFALAPVASRQGAALIIGGAFLVVGLFVLWLARPRHGPRRGAKTAPPPPETIEDEARLTAQILEKEAARLLSGHAKTGVLIALVAGAAVGISPELRAALARQLDKRSGKD